MQIKVKHTIKIAISISGSLLCKINDVIATRDIAGWVLSSATCNYPMIYFYLGRFISIKQVSVVTCLLTVDWESQERIASLYLQ